MVMALDITPRFRTKNVLAALAMASVLLLTTGCGEEDKVGQSGAGSSTGTDRNNDADGDNVDSDSASLTGVDFHGIHKGKLFAL